MFFWGFFENFMVFFEIIGDMRGYFKIRIINYYFNNIWGRFDRNKIKFKFYL